MPDFHPALFSIIEVLIIILTQLFFMPLTMAVMVYSYGRSFWRWFGLGCVLPHVPLFVVHRGKKKLAALLAV